MFRIIKNGASIGLTENLNYIKQAENGCYVLCPEPDASGIVFGGTVYHLLGRTGLDGVETVSLEEADGGMEIIKATEAGGIVFVTMAEAGNIDPETAAEHAELFAEWAYPINYKTGQIRRYKGTLYKCVQNHTSQAVGHLTPLPACGAKPVIPAENGLNGRTRRGAGMLTPGGKSKPQFQHWISTAENNVWEPGVYGWEEVTNAV